MNDLPALLIRIPLEGRPELTLITSRDTDEPRLRSWLRSPIAKVDESIDRWLEEAA